MPAIPPIAIPTGADTDPAYYSELFGRASLPGELPGLQMEVEQLQGLAAQQQLSASWKLLWDALRLPEAGAAAALDQHWHGLQRRVRDDDVTYNTLASDGQMQREWSLELLPVVLRPEEWIKLEHGVLQRVRVLNAMLRDLYGEQELLRSGLLPPALVFGHPDYLPSMHRVYPPHSTYLHVAAFDVIRDASGQWQVLSQRLQAPSGMGYLLENRLAVQQQFSQPFDRLRIRRLAHTYRTWLDSLRKHCAEGAHARIVLLTSGPHNETYFEHVYLARYLGIPLVEGSDLAVRGQRLFLKTMHGLAPVNGVIKRMDDQFLDPLELRPDSQLGIPGLLQVLRAGNVMMANWPGTGFMESSALLGFLPALAEHLLGEKLELPAAPTWWCGEAAVQNTALAMLDDCVIKSTYPKPYPGVAAREYFDPVLTRWLSPEQREQWVTHIQAHGDACIIQAHLPASLQPVWQPQAAGVGLFNQRPLVLRLFALSAGPGAWLVLPGGMARLPQAHDKLSNMGMGGSTADVWIMAGTAPTSTSTPGVPPAPPPSAQTSSGAHSVPLQPREEARLTRRVRVVTSHAAENLFWLGRYTERADNLTRLFMLVQECINGEEQNTAPLMHWLDRMCRDLELLPPDTPGMQVKPATFLDTLFLHMHAESPSVSLGCTLEAMNRAANGVRSRLGLDLWRAVRTAHTDFAFAMSNRHTTNGSDEPQQIQATLEPLKSSLIAITGLQLDHMTRDDGWRLLALGRALERMSFYSVALERAFQSNAIHDFDGYDAVLRLFDSTISFSAIYQQTHQVDALLDLLVLNRENPRSLGYIDWNIRELLTSLHKHAPEGAPDLTLHLPRPAHVALSTLCTTDEVGNYHHLSLLLEQCMTAAFELSDKIGQQHFALYQEARQSVWT